MNVLQTIHLQGYIDLDDGVEFKGDHVSIAERIAGRIDGQWHSSEHERDYDQTEVSLLVPKVSLRMYFSDSEISLEQVTEKVVLNTLGSLDIYQEWYGYSEWTIMGYNVVNFTIGNHDLEEILLSYKGKYAHIVMEILE